jgi:mRNA-degrading endonuclease toxin of MazEF toxin-antitoxin module
MKRGEVWWYERPDRKRRPVLVLTRTKAVGRLSKIITVPATSTVRGWDTEVPLDQDDGMPQPCVLVLDNAQSTRKALLTERVTKLGPERMSEVCRALSAATDC